LINKTTAQRRRRGRGRLRILIAVGSVLLVLLLGLLIDSALYYNKVHAGVSIAGHSVGGLTRTEATAALTRWVEDARKTPIILSSDAKSWPVLPDDVGTKIDVRGAVSEAMAVSRGSNFFADLGRRFTLYFEHQDLPLQATVDSAMMDGVLAKIAQAIDVPPVNPGLAIQGSDITVTQGQKGRVLDQATLGQQLKTLLVTLRAPKLPVPMLPEEPAIKVQNSQQALVQARTMISAPLVVVGHNRQWTLTPGQIAAYLDFTSQDQNGVSTLVPYVSATKMGPFFDAIAKGVARDPVDASFKENGTTAWVIPGQPGEALDRTATAAAVTAGVLTTSGRTVNVAVTTTDPKLTTAAAQAMGIKDRLSTFTLGYVGTPNRQVNVRITTQYASNVFMAPGDVYNFDQQIGPRTAARGYMLAPGITGPNTLEDVLGGGICQVSTTLFNAVFFAGLQVVERHNHSIYIKHYPQGRDATVTGGGKNMRFKNDTQHYIWIVGKSNGVTTTFTIYGTSEGRKVTYTTSAFVNVVVKTTVTSLDPTLASGKTTIFDPGQIGQQCTVVRMVTRPDGTVIHKDTFLSTWQMFPMTILVGTAKTSTTKPPTSTTATTKPTTTTTTKPTTTTTATKPTTTTSPPAT
jgi:vancomycin resistance protein YoaR